MRSEIRTPETASAGQVAQSPNTATRLPAQVAAFQSAGTSRSSRVIGSRWPLPG